MASRESWNLDVLDMDVTSDNSVNQAVQQALDRVGRIDVVITNAGIAALGLTEAYPVEQYQQVFDVNVFGWCASTAPCRRRCGGNAADC